MATESKHENMLKSKFGAFSKMATEKQKTREGISERRSKEESKFKRKLEKSREERLQEIEERRLEKGYQVKER